MVPGSAGGLNRTGLPTDTRDEDTFSFKEEVIREC
jgi:hypothetical protein